MSSHGIKDRVAIIGMGCTPFREHWDKGTDDLMIDAAKETFASAGLDKEQIDAFWFGTAQSAMSGVPMAAALKLDNKPVSRVENFCATGSEALRQACYAVASGAYDTAMALGVEKVKDSGFQGLNAFPIPNDGTNRTLTAAAMFSLVLPAYAEKYGVDKDELRRTVARIASKNHHNGARNPRAMYRREMDVDAICKMAAVAGQLSVMDCAGVADGSAAAIVCRAEDAHKYTDKPLYVKALSFVAGNGSGEIILNESDVLEVFTVSGGGGAAGGDLTGTIINADKPVQVFAGHKCTQIPVGQQACDRLEEAMLPIETLSKKYIVGPPLIPNMQVKAQMVRIIATEDATALTYDPPQGGAPAMLAKAGDYAEIAATNKDFQIVSDKKILVSQYMQSQSAGGNIGDPAMALAVATEQYRSKYLIHAPLSYDTNFANVTAPMDAKVTMDGAPIPALTAIGGTGFGVARMAVPDNADGNHDFVGDKAFGVTIYGYGQYTSYWYPGGLDLEALPQ